MQLASVEDIPQKRLYQYSLHAHKLLSNYTLFTHKSAGMAYGIIVLFTVGYLEEMKLLFYTCKNKVGWIIMKNKVLFITGSL
jgi:hypothetical protein